MDILRILFVLFKVTAVTKAIGCRTLTFLSCMENMTFTGHVTSSFEDSEPESMCKVRCWMDDSCVSINLKPNGSVMTCELSNTDHIGEPSDLVPIPGGKYCPVKNPCSSNPCQAGTKCTPDFSFEKYICKNNNNEATTSGTTIPTTRGSTDQSSDTPTPTTHGSTDQSSDTPTPTTNGSTDQSSDAPTLTTQGFGEGYDK
ncbi:uncharacterized protein LOC116293862 [Actinia tenebrosa]|uniref:Uncharacterized protein LOC116293862 n=1 Tax=Actinia tenebrosa TaxID=6105 RepID=A0A6P8HXA5_ACTTE|nr:uncharacterized protein LOC116293862 [Actinia tenebrosa]